MPGEGEGDEQANADRDRRHQEAPRHGVDDDHQRINSSWWVKRSGQMHGDDCEPDGGGPPSMVRRR